MKLRGRVHADEQQTAVFSVYHPMYRLKIASY